MEIEWKWVDGYENYYQVSSLGDVRSVDRLVIYSNGRKRVHKGITLRPSVTNGYLSVQLVRGVESQPAHVHRLVCKAFHANPENKRTVNHKDGNKFNNHKDNLEWATHSEQHLHAHKAGLKGFKSQSLTIEQAAKILELLKTNRTKKSIAEEFGVCIRTIFHIQSGKTWSKLKTTGSYDNNQSQGQRDANAPSFT